MKNSLFATFVMLISMALMAGEALAQEHAFADMGNVKHISVKDGQITVTKNDDTQDVLVATHNNSGSARYVFASGALSDKSSDEDYTAMVQTGRVVYTTSNNYTPLIGLLEKIGNGSDMVYELVIDGHRSDVYDKISLKKNVKNIILFNLSLANLDFNGNEDLESIIIYNCRFKYCELDIRGCSNLKSVDFSGGMFSFSKLYIDDKVDPKVVNRFLEKLPTSVDILH